MLWNIFNTLQLLLALKLLLVNLPVNVMFIYDFLDETVNFEIIDKRVLYAEMFGGEVSSEGATSGGAEEGETTEDSSSLGDAYGGTNPIMNILFIAMVLTALLFVIAILVLLRMCLVKTCRPSVVNAVLFLERKLMFNAVLRAILESYFMISVKMWFAWRSNKAESKANFITNLAITAFCFIFPVWQHKHLINNQKRV